MRKTVIISSIIFLLIAVLTQSGVIDALLVFLLSGSLPGTSIALSPTMMMALLFAVAWLVIAQMTAVGTVNARVVRRFVTRATKKQQALPKRRYSRI